VHWRLPAVGERARLGMVPQKFNWLGEHIDKLVKNNIQYSKSASQRLKKLDQRDH
jgi:hypothetical protein